MFQGMLEKVAVSDLETLRTAAPLGEEAPEVVAQAKAVGQGVDLLAKRGLLPDATQLLAHALPACEGVRWACRCAREAGQEGAPLETAERWVAEPSEENRRACQAAYEEAGLQTPGAVAALAVFLSGKTLGPAGLPDVPPDPFHAAKAVAGAVLLAAVIQQPEKAQERLRRFLEVGEQVAAGITDQGAGKAAGPGLVKEPPLSPPSSSSSARAAEPRSEPKRPATRRLDSWE